jgi:hypothetical protein
VTPHNTLILLRLTAEILGYLSQKVVAVKKAHNRKLFRKPNREVIVMFNVYQEPKGLT